MQIPILYIDSSLEDKRLRRLLYASEHLFKWLLTWLMYAGWAAFGLWIGYRVFLAVGIDRLAAPVADSISALPLISSAGDLTASNDPSGWMVKSTYVQSTANPEFVTAAINLTTEGN